MLNHAGRTPLLLLKVGGSLLTRREEYCTLDVPRVTAYAAALRTRWSSLAGRLVLILGGGSFGHNTVERFGLHRHAEERDLADTNALTRNMTSLRMEMSFHLREVGIPSYPFHTSSLTVTDGGAVSDALIEPVLLALRAGLLPVLSGDSVFDRRLGHQLFSSDRVPELFVGRTPVERIVVLTDVLGILRREDGALIRSVGPENRVMAMEQAGPSDKQDVTGGMRGKLAPLILAADAGVGSVIADGRVAAAGIRALEASEVDGTWILPTQRVAV